MTQQIMPCASCDKSYPWTAAYWPSLTYAQCWVCWKAGADDQVREARRAQLYYRNQWAPSLALGCMLGALLTWMALR